MEKEPNNINDNQSERAEVDLSNSAAVALVCVSAIFCCLFVLAYCHCYCDESTDYGEEASWNGIFRKRRKRRSPLPLPLVSYSKKADAAMIGCVVCLNEFEDREEVKVIPGCGHMFHPECIDQWLVARMSCPVCRCSKIFGSGSKEEEAIVEIEIEEEVGQEEVGMRLERSRSWSHRARDVDHGRESLLGLRRLSSF